MLWSNITLRPYIHLIPGSLVVLGTRPPGPSSTIDPSRWIGMAMFQLSSVQKSLYHSIIFHYTDWFIGIPQWDYCSPQNMKGSIIPELIINQQGFRTLLKWLFVITKGHLFHTMGRSVSSSHFLVLRAVKPEGSSRWHQKWSNLASKIWRLSHEKC